MLCGKPFFSSLYSLTSNIQFLTSNIQFLTSNF